MAWIVLGKFPSLVKGRGESEMVDWVGMMRSSHSR